jgi:hypothetical protein
MAKTGQTYIPSDLDIFGEDLEMGTDVDNSILGEEEPTDTGTETETIVDETSTETAEEPTEDESTDDILAKIDEILGISEEQEETMTAIEDAAASGDNDEVQNLIADLRSQNAEKDIKIQELTTSNEMLNKKYMDRVADTEWSNLYKGTLDKLESNPQLMLLAKHFDNPEKKEQVVSILSELLGELTGQDIDSLVNTQQADVVSAALNTEASVAEAPKAKGKKQKSGAEMNEDILGF